MLPTLMQLPTGEDDEHEKMKKNLKILLWTSTNILKTWQKGIKKMLRK